MDVLTIAEIAKRLGMPESTVRYYRDRFSSFIPEMGSGKNRRYKPETVEIIRIIAESFKSNLSVESIHQVLLSQFGINIEEQQQLAVAQQQSAVISKEFYDMLDKRFSQLDSRIDIALREIAVIKQENARHNEFVERSMKDRDDRLNEIFMELRQRQQVKKKSFWRTLFRR